MKFIFSMLLIALSCSFISSCGEEKKPKKKKEDSLVEIKNGVYTEYYPKRTAVKFQGPQDKNGLRNGRWFFYSEKGTEQSSTEYANGQKNGLIMVRYPNSNMHYTGFYKNDKEDGEWRFYKENGSLDFIKNYDNGVLVQ
jgi:antitoxin component YwqK of YwqJK toxin-antitoxin module